MRSKIFKFKQGDKVRDTLTGFEGHITARSEFYNGCIRYIVEKMGDKGDLHELSFDEQRLEVVDERKQVDAPARRTGGPRTMPKATGH